MNSLCKLVLLSYLVLLSHLATATRSLLYPEDWTPGYSILYQGKNLALGDYSYAGMKQLPHYPANIDCNSQNSDLPIFHVTDEEGADPTGAQDSTDAIMSAINKARDNNGGIVYFKSGSYLVTRPLVINSPNIFLMGDSSNTPRVRFVADSETSQGVPWINFRGTETLGKAYPTEAADIFSHELQIALGEDEDFDLEVGDHIYVMIKMTSAFVNHIGMRRYWNDDRGSNIRLFQRQITAIESDPEQSKAITVTIDVPLRFELAKEFEPYIVKKTGYLEYCGISNFRLTDTVDPDNVSSTNVRLRRTLLQFDHSLNCYVDNIRSYVDSRMPNGDGLGRNKRRDYEVATKGIIVQESKNITISNVIFQKPQFVDNNGGNGYMFEYRFANETLTKESEGRDARHNFSFNSRFGNSGNVITDFVSGKSRAWNCSGRACIPYFRSRSDFHNRLAMGNLIENGTLIDGFDARNRGKNSSNAGMTSTDATFWNLQGMNRVRSMQFRRGFLIYPNSSTTRNVNSNNFVEGLQSQVTPASLFYDQLARRGVTLAGNPLEHVGRCQSCSDLEHAMGTIPTQIEDLQNTRRQLQAQLDMLPDNHNPHFGDGGLGGGIDGGIDRDPFDREPENNEVASEIFCPDT